MDSKKSNIINRISRWGVTPEMNPTFAKRIILTNFLGLLFTINMSVSALAFYYFGQYSLAVFTLIFVLTEFSWPVLNYFGRYNFSRVGLLISSNLLGFCVSVMLPDTGYNRGFYVMAGIPILLFGIKEKWFMLLGLLFPLILYPVSEWVQYHNPFALSLSDWTQNFISISIGIIYVALIFVMFYFLSRENDRTEKLLEDQRSRSFSSAKFAALGEMASGIGHEINNPMTVIDLNTEQLKFLVEQEPFRKEMAIERLNIISKTVHRVANIVEAMRNFSREGSEDNARPESIKRIIDETLTFCNERFRHHNIHLYIRYSHDDIQINCNAVQISQVILNLLNNAFDAVEVLPQKWVELEIEMKNKKVLISITDSGHGIPGPQREKVFQLFFTTKPVGRGTGLGLSLSRKIIEDHNGKLLLDMAHKHTRFIIELPV